MQPSIVGLVVCVCLLLAGHFARGPVTVGLIASLAFGSTSVATLSALGGASPLAYTFFSGAIVLAVVARRQFWRELGIVFGQVRPIWLLSALTAYAVIGAVLFPRLFRGQTSVFVLAESRQGIVESLLTPVPGNITQSGYLVVNVMTAIALCLILLPGSRLDLVRRGFFLMTWLYVAMGFIDLLGKTIGVGDLLAVIRTANYEMLTSQVENGLARLQGGFPEPSSFAAAGLGCLAFSYTYWRRTGSRAASVLTIATALLLLRSTSSTAYAGLIVLCGVGAIGFLRSVLAGRIQRADIWIGALMALALISVLALATRDETALDPVTELVDSTLLNKASSDSGQGRTYWNVKSIQSVADTQALGTGMGSSRASSWPIAVLSQLGVIGFVAMALLVWVVARGLGRYEDGVDAEVAAIVASVRACALAGLIAACLISGTADPGMIFFIALATVSVARVQARRRTLPRRVVLPRPAPGPTDERCSA